MGHTLRRLTNDRHLELDSSRSTLRDHRHHRPYTSLARRSLRRPFGTPSANWQDPTAGRLADDQTLIDPLVPVDALSPLDDRPCGCSRRPARRAERSRPAPPLGQGSPVGGGGDRRAADTATAPATQLACVTPHPATAAGKSGRQNSVRRPPPLLLGVFLDAGVAAASAVHDQPIDQQQDDRTDDRCQPRGVVEEVIQWMRVEDRMRKTRPRGSPSPSTSTRIAISEPTESGRPIQAGAALTRSFSLPIAALTGPTRPASCGASILAERRGRCERGRDRLRLPGLRSTPERSAGRWHHQADRNPREPDHDGTDEGSNRKWLPVETITSNTSTG